MITRTLAVEDVFENPSYFPTGVSWVPSKCCGFPLVLVKVNYALTETGSIGYKNPARFSMYFAKCEKCGIWRETGFVSKLDFYVKLKNVNWVFENADKVRFQQDILLVALNDTAEPIKKGEALTQEYKDSEPGKDQTVVSNPIDPWEDVDGRALFGDY